MTRNERPGSDGLHLVDVADARPSIPVERLRDVAWFGESFGIGVHPVKTKRADSLRFYDLLGNVAEWGDDWLESRRDETREGKPVTALLAVTFGGSFSESVERLTCAGLSYSDLGEGYNTGFRVVMPADGGR